VKNLEATDLGHGRYSDSAPRLDPIPSPILEQVTVMTEPRAHDERVLSETQGQPESPVRQPQNSSEPKLHQS
jgi:hypothetical protein